MSGLLVLRALLFAGECFLASLLLPLLAFAVSALLRRRAALRHLIWTTMFGVLALLPLAALLLPARQIVQPAAAPPVEMIAAPAVMAVPMAAAPAAPSSIGLLTPGNVIVFLAALWLAGLAFHALRLGLGGLGLRRLRRASVPFASEIATRCAVRLSHGEEGPSTFGILRPVVLLPRSAEGWPAARLEAVLRHESAHVRRRDTASQFLARLVCALYWFNPLLWLAARSLRRAAEIAADDEVLAGGMRPSLYAAELVGLAAQSRGLAPGIAMAAPPLTERVQSVLANNSSRKGVTRMDMAKTVSFGLAATLLLGVARFDIAGAQPAPIPPAAPAPPRALPAPRVNVDARPRIQTNVQVTRQVDADVEIQQRIEAKAMAVKAQADVTVANARARAAAETDPADKKRARQVADQIAAQAAVTKADADLTIAMSRQQQQAAEARARAGADASRIAETRRAITVMRSADNAGRVRDMERARSRTLDGRSTDTVDYGLRFEDGPLAIDAKVTAAMAEAMKRPEVRRAIDEAIQTAMADAHKAISAAIAKATGQSTGALPPPRGTFSYDLPAPDGAFPVPPAPPAPPSPRALPLPPAPPAPFN